jgi:hypothetical protein
MVSLQARHEPECARLAELNFAAKLAELSKDDGDNDDLRTAFAAAGVLRLLRLQAESPQAWAQIRQLETHTDDIRSSKMAAIAMEHVVNLLAQLGHKRDQVEQAYGLIKINRYIRERSRLILTVNSLCFLCFSFIYSNDHKIGYLQNYPLFPSSLSLFPSPSLLSPRSSSFLPHPSFQYLRFLSLVPPPRPSSLLTRSPHSV